MIIHLFGVWRTKITGVLNMLVELLEYRKFAFLAVVAGHIVTPSEQVK